MKQIFILVLVAVVATACRQQESSTTVTDPHAGSDPSAVDTIEMMSNAGTLDMAGLRYDLPEGWTREEPSSSMRLDQATIPGPEGNGQLVVFFFGAGGGGGLEANLARWAGQVQHDVEPARETFDVGGFSVTTIAVEGTLLPSGMGEGPTEPQPESVLYGAVVEGEGGPWFFKATGPRGTMEAQHDAFIAMLRSVRANV
jgi:hypothetical protein